MLFYVFNLGNLPDSMTEICESNGKEKGGPWECYNARDFYGWESNNVVAVTRGGVFTLELLTRAKTKFILILVEAKMGDRKNFYAAYLRHFIAAADKGLVKLPASVNASESASESTSESEGLDALSNSAIVNQSENEFKCCPCCALS